MLWGNFAKDFKRFIGTDFHIAMEWIHPSPLAQNVRGLNSQSRKFINCDHFTNVNKHLIEHNTAVINWNSINNVSEIKSENQKIQTYAEILNINKTHHIAFTDGSCFPNTKNKDSRAGWASKFVSGELTNTVLYGNLDITNHFASNIRAEGYAIIRTMEMIYNLESAWTKLTIITDCMFWIDMCEKYMKKWNQAMFIAKANSDMTMRMWLIYNKLAKKGDVVFMHIKSHNKDGWKNFNTDTFERFCYDQNEYVDRQCNYARHKLNTTEEVIKQL
jgi:hypothetical protein